MLVVCFGEVMGRLTPPGFLRLKQAIPGNLEMTFGGAEANVAVGIAALGGTTKFASALPKNALGDSCISTLRGLGVDTSHILSTDKGRLGLYFLETGANQRPSLVVYDREFSSIAITPSDQYPWESIFQNADWFHISGITPALSAIAAEASLSAVNAAKKAGLQISCDMNFRKKLWQWDEGMKPRDLAEKTMRQLLNHVDIVIANEEDAADVLNIHAENTDVHAGKLTVDRYPDVARQIIAQFKNVSKVAITLRESISASHNNWGAMLFDAKEDKAYFAPISENKYSPYQIHNIVDRVGGGDAFAAGLIFSLLTPELASPQTSISFAAAFSCLAHSIQGDFNYTTRQEVEALMKGSGSGRVIR
jgi:2-dehydro-3-deoxygluconokinase